MARISSAVTHESMAKSEGGSETQKLKRQLSASRSRRVMHSNVSERNIGRLHSKLTRGTELRKPRNAFTSYPSTSILMYDGLPKREIRSSRVVSFTSTVRAGDP